MSIEFLVRDLKNRKIDILLDDSKVNLRITGNLKNLSEEEKRYLISNKQEIISLLIADEINSLAFNKEIENTYVKREQLLDKVFWDRELKGEIQLIDLPTKKTTIFTEKPVIESISHQFSDEFLMKIKEFSKNNEVNLLTVLISGVKVLLKAYTNQEDILIGIPIVNNMKNNTSFLSILPIRTKFEEEICFLDLTLKINQNISNLYEHRFFSFKDFIIEKVKNEELNRGSLVNVAFTLLKDDFLKDLIGEETIKGLYTKNEIDNLISEFDISFTFLESSKLELVIKFNSQIYDSNFIENSFYHFNNFIINANEYPKEIIEKIDFITDKEKDQLFNEFNKSDIHYTKESTIN